MANKRLSEQEIEYNINMSESKWDAIVSDDSNIDNYLPLNESSSSSSHALDEGINTDNLQDDDVGETSQPVDSDIWTDIIQITPNFRFDEQADWKKEGKKKSAELLHLACGVGGVTLAICDWLHCHDGPSTINNFPLNFTVQCLSNTQVFKSLYESIRNNTDAIDIVNSYETNLKIVPGATGKILLNKFNRVSFWTVQEILSRPTPKQRSEILGHFIKISKKLYELNDLHSFFAIISALQSASIYRLSKTWGGISKKEKQLFDKLAEVFSDTDNWAYLRKHIESLKLPCIPYLGLYLTDLVYIDMAHPVTGGFESQQRTAKMNKILHVISNYQKSDYTHLTPLPHIQNYLKSIRYIEELQKFVEDDQYKLSLKLEPPAVTSSSKEAVAADAATILSLNLSPAKASGGSLRLHAITSGSKYMPGHRKCNSLGTNLFGKTHAASSEAKEYLKGLHLLDDSELEDDSTLCLSNNEPPSPTIEVPYRGSFQCEEDCTLLTRSTDDASLTSDSLYTMQGCVRRKAVLKEGRKPTVASWQRFWIQIWNSSLAYFSPKTFKGARRCDFKSEPCKMMSLIGCTVKLSDSPLHLDTFHIIDHHRGNVYKFKTGNVSIAEKWCRHLQQASTGDTDPLPANLMSFE
ncbi:hypothetical protein FQA39_LY05230 [Lamprigera yunnana]|nr:hypothetical protein FQA39_LY05230 [Lamprigera yunnana]